MGEVLGPSARAVEPDAAVVARLRNGDESALADLLDAWSGGLLRVARSLVADDDAAAVVQAAWLAAIRDVASFDGGMSFKAWVYQALVATATRRGLRDGHADVRGVVLATRLATDGDAGPTVDASRFQPPGSPYEGHWRAFPAPWPDATAEPAAAEVRQRVAAALDGLPDGQRIVITLRDVEGLGADDVAGILGMPVEEQHQPLHRARAHVRAELEAYFVPEGVQPSPAGGSGLPGRAGLRRRLMPLYVAATLQGVGLWVPVEKLFMTEIGFTPATIGVMAAAYAAFTPIVEVPSGIVADRWSRRGVLVVASAALALSALIGGLSNNVPTYFASALVLGVYFAAYSGTMEAVVYDTVLEETGDSEAFQSRLGRIRFVESAALVASSLAGGWLAAVTSTRLTYFLTVPFVGLSIVVYLLFREPRLHKAAEPTSLRQPGRRHVPDAHRRRATPAGRHAGRARVARAVGLLEFGPLWLVALAASAVVYGPYWAALVSTLGIGGLLAGRLRLDRWPVLATVTTLMTLSAIVLTWSRNLVVVTAAQVVLACSW